ncbi:MAG: epoxyqueuosine reductase QueH [Oscillospiraceae bacterium]|jgi:predicted adenine nucleotide alpha hydrolase (AANH) superfamily ATPase|nr:epoxyqueuosine reductase QueH [Oscillospiraceae bacterium]
MKTLLHVCCAPCAVACVKSLEEEGFSPHGFFYNPNIHPFAEYTARLDTLTGFASSNGLALTVRGEYALRPFLSRVWPDKTDGEARCAECYDMRMDAAAAFAAENGFQSFTTTLLISPYQRHDLIREKARLAAQKHGVDFLYRDFRPLFREGQRAARELGLYRQKYCGCVFSEGER